MKYFLIKYSDQFEILLIRLLNANHSFNNLNVIMMCDQIKAVIGLIGICGAFSAMGYVGYLFFAGLL